MEHKLMLSEVIRYYEKVEKEIEESLKDYNVKVKIGFEFSYEGPRTGKAIVKISFRSSQLGKSYDLKTEDVSIVSSFNRIIKSIEQLLNGDEDMSKYDVIEIDESYNKLYEEDGREWITLQEAAKLWNKIDSTLRRTIHTKLNENERKKLGNSWMLSYEAMERVYGESKNE